MEALPLAVVLCSYEQLLGASDKLASQLSRVLPAATGADGPRIGVYAEPGPGYVAATWASWMAGGIAVPLAVSHPPEELQYVMEDAGISMVSCSCGCAWLARLPHLPSSTSP